MTIIHSLLKLFCSLHLFRVTDESFIIINDKKKNNNITKYNNNHNNNNNNNNNLFAERESSSIEQHILFLVKKCLPQARYFHEQNHTFHFEFNSLQTVPIIFHIPRN